jgi:hypothetical protein
MVMVVWGIELDRRASPPVASGGHLVEITPWAIEEDHLRVVSYLYRRAQHRHERAGSSCRA